MDEELALVVSSPHAYMVDEQVAIWLHAKANKAGSEKTK